MKISFPVSLLAKGYEEWKILVHTCNYIEKNGKNEVYFNF